MPIVLIADDEPIVRLLLRETLNIDPSLSFLEVSNGVDALETARAACPDVILLDIMMPKMDGFQVCRLLKADPTLHNIPVILVTAYGTPGNETAGCDAGATAFIRKPFEDEDLVKTVAQALRSRIP